MSAALVGDGMALLALTGWTVQRRVYRSGASSIEIIPAESYVFGPHDCVQLIVEYPHRYKLVPAGEDFADLIPAPGFVTQEGTPLNKAALLSDETAAALGLTQEDPTVDDALAAAELALKQLGSDLAAGVHIAAGSYTGTGTYGASDPNILTFDFEPEVVFVFQKDYSPVQTFVNDSWSGSTYVDTVFSFDLIYFFRGGASTRVGALKTKDLNGNLGQGNTQMPYTMEGNTLSWKYTDPNYGSGNIAPRAQFNESGTVYHYIAIGRGNAA